MSNNHRLEGTHAQSLKVRFFTHEEQREWEHQYPKPPGDVSRAEGEAKR
jgi:hypothetical protein